MRRMRRLRDERGMALVLALGILLSFAIMITGVIDYTSSNSRSSSRDASAVSAEQYADAGLNNAYSIINYANTSAANPTAANLLGCAGANGTTSDTTGPSICTSPYSNAICVPVAASCPTSTTRGKAGTASIYGYFSGVTAQTYNGMAVPKSTWVVTSTGYARNSSGNNVTAKSRTASVTISTMSGGAVASVWNHVFITGPLVANQCQLDMSGNGLMVTVPIYVIGNVCLSGANASVQENAGGQAIDMQVGGKLVLNGSGSKVGTDASHPIYSGVVVGGCTTVSVSSSTTPCSSASFNYWVGHSEAFIPNDAPGESAADIANDYQKFDPGPSHPCQTGTTSPGPTLAASNFDNDATQNTSAGTFNLTPNTSYSCVSTSGASTGQLSWDASAKKLTVAGSIFIDGNATVTQNAAYVGTAILELAGTFSLLGNSTQLCAKTVGPCDLVNWQGSSSNQNMLTIAPLATNNPNAVLLDDNQQVFQASLWTQPSSGMYFTKNGVTVEGPMSIGRPAASFNGSTLMPLPVITNMPVGAPLPPNASVTVGPLVYVK